MRLFVVHRTAYHYDAAISFGIQYLRLTPYANASQRAIRWNIEAPGQMTRWIDAFGNQCDTLILVRPGASGSKSPPRGRSKPPTPGGCCRTNREPSRSRPISGRRR